MEVKSCFGVFSVFLSCFPFFSSFGFSGSAAVPMETCVRHTNQTMYNTEGTYVGRGCVS